MIDDDSKYFSLSGDLPVGGPTTWHIIDWDQRRVVSVTMDGEQEDETVAIEHFSRHSSQLSPEVYRIHISHTGDIIAMFTDPKSDQTCCVHYPFLHEVQLPEGIKTVRRDELEELERLGPDVDLVAYPPCQGKSSEKVVFKYYFLWQYAYMSWKEMNLWMRLPSHPNIVPFDRVVVDELMGRVVGFTNRYVPGGSLEENRSRIFKLKWLDQLIQVVDDLNLRHNIAHQDVAPRNLLVDDATDCVMLYDFNFAARINQPSLEDGENYVEDRNDVKGVVFTIYEIITRDNSLRSVPHEEQNIDDLGIAWVKHPDVKLDHPVESYRAILQDWQERRAALPGAIDQHDAPQVIDWPSRPRPPPKTSFWKDVNGQPVSFTEDGWIERRQEVLNRADKVLNWERPPQRLLDGGTRVLSNGELINC